MKKFDTILPFLKGDSFNDKLVVRIDYKYDAFGREKVLRKYLENKKVIHLGCLDHVPLIKKRIEEGEWLHINITNIATKCIGLDINEDGIDYVRKELNIKNVLFGDITKGVIPELINEEWDYIILGEVLEHIDNPVDFLKKIKENYKNIDKIIITVPNILNRDNYVLAKKCIERINSDHRFWFTPYTIMKLLTVSNITISEIIFANHTSLSIKDRLKYKANRVLKIKNKLSFFYFKNLIAIGKLH